MKGGTKMARKDNTVTDALMLVGGGLFGAGVALLLAPRSGRETRREIVRFARTTGEKADRIVHDVSGNVADYAGSVGEKASLMLNSGRNKLEKHGHRVAKWIGGCNK
jgi:gas vesicle protein